MSTEKTAWMARLGMRHPIIQAPMAGTSTPALAAAVTEAGGLGSLGIGASGTEQARQQIVQTRALTSGAFNVNLFCHRPARADAQREAAWLAHLAPEFARFGAKPPAGLNEIYATRSEEHTSELQSPCNLVCRLLLEKKKTNHSADPADS